jgi:hypothetical protein
MRCSMASMPMNTRSTSTHSARASGVGTSRPPVRWNSSMPACASSRLSDWLMAGCVTCSKAAALRVELPRISARNVSISANRIDKFIYRLSI